LALVQISRIERPSSDRAPAHYYVTRRRQDGWSPLVEAGGGMAEGAPNFAWFSPDGCYLHYTRNYSAFVRVPLATVAGTPP
jgi:hypothetical protein